MAFAEELLEDGSSIWEAQKEHPFVTELAEGTLEDSAFRHWIRQDYRYLLDYARTFAIASAQAKNEEIMGDLVEIAHSTLNVEMDLHRDFAEDYGISREQLESTRKSPTCESYTNFLIRTAYNGSLAEISAAIYPCGKGFLDIGEHMNELATEEHQYTPFIEMYTSDEFREVVDTMTKFVNQCAEQYPNQQESMRETFLTCARLEWQFWEMAYTEEEWKV